MNFAFFNTGNSQVKTHVAIATDDNHWVNRCSFLNQMCKNAIFLGNKCRSSGFLFGPVKINRTLDRMSCEFFFQFQWLLLYWKSIIHRLLHINWAMLQGRASEKEGRCTCFRFSKTNFYLTAIITARKEEASACHHFAEISAKMLVSGQAQQGWRVNITSDTEYFIISYFA